MKVFFDQNIFQQSLKNGHDFDDYVDEYDDKEGDDGIDEKTLTENILIFFNFIFFDHPPWWEYLFRLEWRWPSAVKTNIKIK